MYAVCVRYSAIHHKQYMCNNYIHVYMYRQILLLLVSARYVDIFSAPTFFMPKSSLDHTCTLTHTHSYAHLSVPLEAKIVLRKQR